MTDEFLVHKAPFPTPTPPRTAPISPVVRQERRREGERQPPPSWGIGVHRDVVEDGTGMCFREEQQAGS